MSSKPQRTLFASSIINIQKRFYYHNFSYTRLQPNIFVSANVSSVILFRAKKRRLSRPPRPKPLTPSYMHLHLRRSLPLRKHIHISACLLLLRARALPSLRSTQQIVNAARVAHARAWSRRRS